MRGLIIKPGDTIPSGGLIVHAQGVPGNVENRIVTMGGAFSTVEHGISGSHSGWIDFDGSRVDFRNIRSIDEVSGTATRSFRASTASQSLTFRDGAVVGDGITTADGSSDTHVTFTNPTAWLVIGESTVVVPELINIAQLDSVFDADVTIYADRIDIDSLDAASVTVRIRAHAGSTTDGGSSPDITGSLVNLAGT